MIPRHSYDESLLHFHAVDEHARRANPTDSATFESLVEYLRSPIANDPTEDILMARALLVWMSHVLSSEINPGVPDSPIGLVQDSKANLRNRPKVFKTLCGHANIECEVVVGRTKAQLYQGGDVDSTKIQGHTWNAFKAEGQWHLVHPVWCQVFITDVEYAGDYIVEVNGTKQIRQTINNDGKLVNVFFELWFCVNPEIAKHLWFPNDQRWQCLSTDKVIPTVDAFLSLPFLRAGYFWERLTLLHPKSCNIEASDGKCSIVLQAPKNQGKLLKFSYTLLAQDIGNINVDTMPLLVLFMPNNPPDTFTFDISLPVVGLYRLGIQLIENTVRLRECCHFKIDCKRADQKCRKLPVYTGIQGWGFGPDAEAAGLRRPSSAGTMIPLKTPTKDKKGTLRPIVEFKVDADAVDEKEFSADIYKSSDSADNTEKAVVNVDRRKRQLSVQSPYLDTLNQSALVVSCKDKTDPASQAKPVVNYILTSDTSDADAATRKLTREAKQTYKQETKTRLKSARERIQYNIDRLHDQIADE